MPRSSTHSTKARSAAPTRHKLEASANDLALLLQIDYLKGDNAIFLRRLQNALEDAFRQGTARPH